MEIERKYVLILISLLALIVFLVLGASRYLFLQDIAYTSDDVLRKYQLAKLSSEQNIEVLIVGDSSAGNGIDAEFFSQLSSRKTINVALTGGAGILSSYNMVRHALKTQPKLKTVILVTTLDIWRRPFSINGYIETLGDLSSAEISGVSPSARTISKAQFTYNPKEVYWYLRYLYVGVIGPQEIVHDYMRQDTSTYANRGRTFDRDVSLSSIVNPQKVAELQKFGELCEETKLNCIFMHGPIHEAWFNNSSDELALISAKLAEHIPASIHFVPTYFVYPNEMMGDSKDHVDGAYKRESTLKYYAELVELLAANALRK